MFHEKEIGELLAKNIARAAEDNRRTTSGIWRIFAEMISLYLLKVPINTHYRRRTLITSTAVSMF